MDFFPPSLVLTECTVEPGVNGYGSSKKANHVGIGTHAGESIIRSNGTLSLSRPEEYESDSTHRQQSGYQQSEQDWPAFGNGDFFGMSAERTDASVLVGVFQRCLQDFIYRGVDLVL